MIGVSPLHRVVCTLFAAFSLWSQYTWLGIVGFLWRAPRSRTRELRAVRLKRTLERLGGTYVKFGQIAAMREDYVPPEYTRQLRELLDEVEPFPSEVARSIVEKELGAPVGALFDDFPDEPVASASFGQVYRARLHSGKPVAVKVQRPSIAHTVAIDLRVMRALAWVVDLSTFALPSRVSEVVDEFVQWTQDELDYRKEARYAEQIRVETADDPGSVIPAVHWAFTTRRVLTADFIDGVSLKEILDSLDDPRAVAELRARGISFTLLTRNLIHALVRQAFGGGRFHADPHAGNIIVLDDSRVALIDFGICGYLGAGLKRRLLHLMREMGRGDADAAFWASVRVIDPGAEVDLLSFRREYRRNLERWLGVSSDRFAPLRERSALSLMISSMRIVKDHGISVQTMVLRYYRALMLVDIIGLQLCPKMDLRVEISYALREVLTERWLERDVDMGAFVASMAEFVTSLPSRLEELAALRREDRLMVRRDVRVPWRVVLRETLRPAGFLAIPAGLAAGAWEIGARFATFAPPPWAPAVVGAWMIGGGFVATWLARHLGRR